MDPLLLQHSLSHGVCVDTPDSCASLVLLWSSMEQAPHVAFDALLAGLVAGLLERVFFNYLWARLRGSDCASFRLACKQTHQVANELITGVTLDMDIPDRTLPPPPPPYAEAPQFSQQAWWDSGLKCTAFLSRLPKLMSTTFNGWTNELHLAAWLLHIGGACGTHITSLKLSSMASELTLCSAGYLRSLFPHLKGLHLDAPCSGVFFHALRLTQLTKLTLGSACKLPEELWPSLGRLSTLESLTLECSSPREAFAHLSGLRSLAWFSINNVSEDYTLVDTVPVLQLTQLTFLSLADIQYGDEDALSASDVEKVALQSALTQFGRLTRLQFLELGSGFVLDDSAAAALGLMTSLSGLSVGTLRLTKPAPDSLDGLSSLTLFRQCTAVGLLESFRHLPLLVNLETLELPVLVLDADDASSAAEVEAALSELAQLLAPMLLDHACPDEMQIHVQIKDASHMSISRAVACLQPLSTLVDGLVFAPGSDLMDPDWGAIASSLPDLKHLVISNDCMLSEWSLTAMAVHMSQLEDLYIEVEGGLPREVWVMLSAARRTPLKVHATPPLSEQVLAECVSVQLRAYGPNNVAWV